MTVNLTVNKKIMLLIATFILFFGIISVAFLLLNPPDKQYINNPGGTGGDYTPANTVTVTNSGLLYDYIGSTNTTELQALFEKAVLYNVSISNDPAATSGYVQADSFNIDTAKYYKIDASYTLTIDNDKINSAGTPWHYWFTMTTNDSRHFRVDLNADPDIEKSLFSIKKTN